MGPRTALRRTAAPRRPRAGLSHRRGVRRRPASALVLGDNIFYGHGLTEILRRGGRACAKARPSSPIRSATPSVMASSSSTPRQGDVARGKAGEAEVALGGHRALFLRRAGAAPRRRAEDVRARRIRDHRSQPSLSRTRRAQRASASGADSPGSTPARRESLLQAAEYVHAVEQRQGQRIACLEEIAFQQGWIGVEDIRRAAAQLSKNGYGAYLAALADERAAR